MRITIHARVFRRTEDSPQRRILVIGGRGRGSKRAWGCNGGINLNSGRKNGTRGEGMGHAEEVLSTLKVLCEYDGSSFRMRVSCPWCLSLITREVHLLQVRNEMDDNVFSTSLIPSAATPMKLHRRGMAFAKSSRRTHRAKTLPLPLHARQTTLPTLCETLYRSANNSPPSFREHFI